MFPSFVNNLLILFQVLGHICYHILAAGLNGYMATVTNLKNPVNKWRCGAAPIAVCLCSYYYFSSITYLMFIDDGCVSYANAFHCLMYFACLWWTVVYDDCEALVSKSRSHINWKTSYSSSYCGLERQSIWVRFFYHVVWCMCAYACIVYIE